MWISVMVISKYKAKSPSAAQIEYTFSDQVHIIWPETWLWHHRIITCISLPH